MFFGRAYWPRSYWGIGYWGPDDEEEPPPLDFTGIYGGGIRGIWPGKTRGKRRDDYDANRARYDAWEAIEQAREEDRRKPSDDSPTAEGRETRTRPPRVPVSPDQQLEIAAATTPEWAQQQAERKRRQLVALALILAEV